MSHHRATEYLEAFREEVSHWPGVTIEFGVSSRHQYGLVRLGAQSRKVFFPSSPSDSRRGALNAVTDLRKALRDVGATRTEVHKAEHSDRHHKPARGHKPIKPGEKVERPDTWLGPLQQIKERMTA